MLDFNKDNDYETIIDNIVADDLAFGIVRSDVGV